MFFAFNEQRITSDEQRRFLAESGHFDNAGFEKIGRSLLD